LHRSCSSKSNPIMFLGDRAANITASKFAPQIKRWTQAF